MANFSRFLLDLVFGQPTPIEALVPPAKWNTQAEIKQAQVKQTGVRYMQDGTPYRASVVQTDSGRVEEWEILRPDTITRTTNILTEEDKTALAAKKLNPNKAVQIKQLYASGTTAKEAARALDLSPSLIEKCFAAFGIAKNSIMQ
jgi:hypothetical protein